MPVIIDVSPFVGFPAPKRWSITGKGASRINPLAERLHLPSLQE
jgi:hypothetical protein